MEFGQHGSIIYLNSTGLPFDWRAEASTQFCFFFLGAGFLWCWVGVENEELWHCWETASAGVVDAVGVDRVQGDRRHSF